ncbi:MAG: NAD(P)H-dependent oxidoreductase [Phycisphaerales bacterium]
MARVLIICGHPDPDSFVAALCREYAEGARKGGHEVRQLVLSAIKFDPILRGRKHAMPLEPDLLAAQDSIKWCQHLVVGYPTWWGSMPALLKGFIDRTILPGFGYQYRKGSPLWDRLLAGRSARVMVTMDAPSLYDLLVYWASSRRTMTHPILRFCGFKPVRTSTFSSVKSSTAERRTKWLASVGQLGIRAI